MTAAPSLTLVEAQRILNEYRHANRHRLAWLYAIQMGEDGPIKLGIAKIPAERLATLQQGNAQKLHGIAAWRGLPEEEAWLHGEFASARIRGEWFRPTPELVEFVLRMGCDFCDWDLAQRRRDQVALRDGRELEVLP